MEIAERQQRVILLLQTLNDPYPTPRLALAPDSGPAASRYVPCETCGRRGEVRVPGGWKLCLVCDGRGEKRREGEPAWDAYLDMPLEEATALTVPIMPRRPRIEGEDAFVWERLRARYDRHGSYAAVRQQLRWLAGVQPRRHALVRSVHVDHDERVLTVIAKRDLDLGVLALTLRLGRVRVPTWLIEQTAADRRRQSIQQLRADGFNAGQIAKQLGLSRKTVQRRLRRAA